MIKCVCGKEFNSERGFKIHFSRMGEGHKIEMPVDAPNLPVEPLEGESITSVPYEEEKVVIESNRIDVLDPKKTIADVVIPKTGEVVISYDYERHGERFAEYAVGMARKKGLEVKFR
jgi:hypothetical protein